MIKTGKLSSVGLALALTLGCGPEGPTPRTEQQIGIFPGPAGPRELSYREINGRAVVEGDITFPLPDRGEVHLGLTTAGAPRGVPTQRWPGGIVSYCDQLPVGDTRTQQAIDIWAAATDTIQFVDDCSATNRVTIRTSAPGTYCTSAVGMETGEQFIDLEDTCTYGNLVHEFGHAVGLWHEHNRTDRDDHVIFNAANTDDPDQFTPYGDVLSTGVNVGPYDFDSIMHYESYALSNNGLPVLTKLNGSTFTNQHEALSDTDVCAVNRYYGRGSRSDFNGDGYDDLAVGIPGEDVLGSSEGAIIVSYGSATGLSVLGQYLDRNVAGVEGNVENGAAFGSSLAVGDFNGDCLSDLAVGVPLVDVNGKIDAGSVHVFYGSVLGLNLFTDVIFHADGTNVAGVAEAQAQFGAALAAGDFNGDGRDDLAVGSPYRDINGKVNAGSVTILYSNASGLDASGSIEAHQDTGNVDDVVEANDNFGRSLAAGDFNGDGFAELAIGVPGESAGAIASGGAVAVLMGSINGLSGIDDQLLTQTVFGGAIEANDLFGWSLTTGDFDGNGFADLAIGVPNEDTPVLADSGEVDVIYGSIIGLHLAIVESWTQATPGIAGGAEALDLFGRSLTTGDFDGDNFDDLAVGVPLEDLAAGVDVGAVTVIFGNSGGLESNGSQVWSQDEPGVVDLSEPFDYFGNSLTSGDYNGDGKFDLVVGVPYEDVGGIVDAGAVHYFPGSATGPSSVGDVYYPQSNLSPAISEAGDLFGAL